MRGFKLSSILISFFFQLQEGVESRATQSVRVPVKNLAQLVPSLDILEVETAIGFNFLRTNIDGEDIGEEGTCHISIFDKILLKVLFCLILLLSIL